MRTGIAPANNWLVDFRFKTPATFVNDTTFFGRGYASKQYLFIFQNDGGTKFRFYGSSNYTVSTPVANTDYRLVIDPASYLTLTGGGSETRKAIDRSINGSGNFAIFGANTGARLGTFTFYRMKISANYTPTRDFVPAANAAGDIGLYDQVNNVFYKNKTETPFETGAEVPQSRFGRVMDETPTFHFSRSVSVTAATADAVMSVPLENFTPSFSLMVHVLWSSEMSHFSASQGCTFIWSSNLNRASVTP